MKMKRNWKQIVVIGFGYQITDSFIDRVVRIKGSLDQSHFIFEINVGKSRIRHITTLNLNDISSIDFESIQKFIILFQSRCMSDPTLSDIDFKNKMAWV